MRTARRRGFAPVVRHPLPQSAQLHIQMMPVCQAGERIEF